MSGLHNVSTRRNPERSTSQRATGKGKETGTRKTIAAKHYLMTEKMHTIIKCYPNVLSIPTLNIEEKLHKGSLTRQINIFTLPRAHSST